MIETLYFVRNFHQPVDSPSASPRKCLFARRRSRGFEWTAPKWEWMGSKSSGTDSSGESRQTARSPTNTRTWSTSACLRWSQNRWTASNSMWPATTSSRTFSSSSHNFPTTNNNTFTGTLSNCCSSIHSLIGGGAKNVYIGRTVGPAVLRLEKFQKCPINFISRFTCTSRTSLYFICCHKLDPFIIRFLTRVTIVLWKFEAVINWCVRIEAKPKHRGFRHRRVAIMSHAK